MELKGIIIFKLSNIDSNSEAILPYLYVGNAQYVKIYLVDDNPFENNMLKAYDSKNVIIEGDYDEYKTFIIETIKEDIVQEPKEELDKDKEIELCEDK